MFLERFLYDHLGIVVAVLMFACNWAADHQLITGWHHRVGYLAVSVLALYLIASQGEFNRWTLVVAAFAALLTWHVWKTRPRERDLDGSHEAL